jgi:hypothetical protein
MLLIFTTTGEAVHHGGYLYEFTNSIKSMKLNHLALSELLENAVGL